MSFQYGVKQIKVAAALTKTLPSLSIMEITRISDILVRNLNQGTRTLLAVSDNTIVAFQLDVGMNFKTVESAFYNAQCIFTVATSKDDSFKPHFTKASFKDAQSKANKLDMPLTRSAVTSMIHFHKGTVSVDKGNITRWYNDFVDAGNIAMANYLKMAIAQKVY